jgi:hypothetical protein
VLRRFGDDVGDWEGLVIDLRQRLDYSDAVDVLSDQLDDAESLNGAFVETLLEIERGDSGSEIPRGPSGVPILDIKWTQRGS